MEAKEAKEETKVKAVKTVTLRIHRYDGGRKWQQNYTVQATPGLTVLRALMKIKEEQDPTLTFTASCRMGLCGACAVRVNGNAELACDVPVAVLTKRYETDVLTIEPLGNFRVIRDLVVDWEPKYARLKKVKPVLTQKSDVTVEEGSRQTPAEFNVYKKYAACILCGSCVSECNKNRLNQKDFLDPFAFVRAERLAADSTSKSPEEHVKAVVASGLWRCFNCQECTAKCPKGLDPAGAIEKLRIATFRYKLPDTVGSRHAKAIYDDIQESGTLDESKLNIKSEGFLMAGLRAPMALRLMRVGKMNPLDKHPVNPEIKTIDAVVKTAEQAGREE